MSHGTPQGMIRGVCPNCGHSQLKFIQESLWTAHCTDSSVLSGYGWDAQCCQCQAYLQCEVTADCEIDKQVWRPMTEEEVEFVYGRPSPHQV
jgi:hypothetical protein